MYFVSDLLELCNKGYEDKKIYLIFDKEHKIPMSTRYYVVDDIFFFEVKFDNKIDLDNNSFIGLLESECENDKCWRDNLYISPMGKVGNCELRFTKNMEEVYNDNFDNYFEIVNIQEEDTEILIYLK